VKGHRQYLEPNNRLVSARETVWIAPVLRGHRAKILGDARWAGRSGVLRTEPLRVSSLRAPATIASPCASPLSQRLRG
jgi:hypothetical protein